MAIEPPGPTKRYAAEYRKPLPSSVDTTVYGECRTSQGVRKCECIMHPYAEEVKIFEIAGFEKITDPERAIISSQQRLQRFEKTNEMLINCNHLSSTRFQSACSSFKQHNQVLTELKKDLDYIFKKLKKVKTKLSTTYPKEFENAMASALALNEEEEEDLATTEDQQEGVEEPVCYDMIPVFPWKIWFMT
nr:EOG090X0CBU [Artemia franciscana]